nr:unnamed protein product [Callosobruchus chinensis]
MLYIDEGTVKDILKWEKTFNAVETAMQRVSEGRIVQKPRTMTFIPNTANVMGAMPGYLDDKEFGALGCKLVTSFPNNAKLENPLPSVNANILILDETTGIMKAVIAGTEITTQRTAAASAVATEYLYISHSKPCGVLAILGTGVQGRIHAEMFWHLFGFQEVRLWNRSKEKAKKLAEELNKNYNTNAFRYCESNETCIRGADVIVTATNSPDPIVQLSWVKPGAHINAVGANRHHFNELDREVYRNADLFVDSIETSQAEMAGLNLDDSLKGEVGAVINGTLPVSPKERITIFNGIGK